MTVSLINLCRAWVQLLGAPFRGDGTASTGLKKTRERVEVAWPRKTASTTLVANNNKHDHRVDDAELEAFMASIPVSETNLVTV